MMAVAYIGLGANLGNRAATLRAAVERLANLGSIIAVSGLYETEPIGYQDQPAFLNAAVGLGTAKPPHQLLRQLLGIERDLGRTRSFPNAPRTLDLDLLLYDDFVIDTPELTVPHPRLHQRRFVLAPLAEIAPSVLHPVQKSSIAQLLAVLMDSSQVDLWQPAGWNSAAE